MKEINPYDFVKFSFIKDCLFFGKKERFFIVLGISTWTILILLIAVFIGVLTLAKELL